MALYNDDEITDITKVSGVLPVRDALPIPVGKIPTHATQIIASQTKADGIEIVHTVTAGKTLYLSSVAISIDNSAAVSGRGRVFIYNATPIEVYRIFSLRALIDAGIGQSLSFLPPMELAASWSIRVESSLAAVNVTCFIHGYEL